ncbi:MAG: PCYCGC motif-containing (lipo)protein [Vicinamibacterales bacterium]
MRTSIRVGALGVGLALLAGVGLVARHAPATRPQPAAAPRQQAPKVTTPPLVTTGYAAARPLGLTRSVYDFAAQHPEVLRYVPCYCGCEAEGHPHNESCFVRSRDAKGNVTQWDMHGFG